MEEYLAEIRFIAGTYPPRNWMFCEGQILAINDNQALYSLLGTTYGGDGRVSFALPDFRGKTAVGADYQQLRPGNFGGQEQVALTIPELPAHTHAVQASANSGDSQSAENAVFAQTNGTVAAGRDSYPISSESYNKSLTNLSAMNSGVVSSTGNTAPHNNMQPFLGMHYIICINGIYPSRDN